MTTMEYVSVWKKKFLRESEINVVLDVLIGLSGFCDIILSQGERLGMMDICDELAHEFPRR